MTETSVSPLGRRRVFFLFSQNRPKRCAIFSQHRIYYTCTGIWPWGKYHGSHHQSNKKRTLVFVDDNMHPLVRKLYKEALHVGKDHPLGLGKVRMEWKKAIRNPSNCPSCYNIVRHVANNISESDLNNDVESSEHGAVALIVPTYMHSKEYPNPGCERELRKAVGKGRYMIGEMIGVIQLKKYRSLKQRYSNDNDDSIARFRKPLAKFEHEEVKKLTEIGHHHTKTQKE
mmetsp:Transcript_12125/g.24171  ORF Transcript_12125/g.24171 Transcript_12125/m.24171 type:complete len:229 (-) Transcript_12125:1507-2193(-)